MAAIANLEGAEANAHLMKTAPELLKACADLLNACDKQMAARNQGISGEVLSAMEQARATITKAVW